LPIPLIVVTYDSPSWGFRKGNRATERSEVASKPSLREGVAWVPKAPFTKVLYPQSPLKKGFTPNLIREGCREGNRRCPFGGLERGLRPLPWEKI